MENSSEKRRPFHVKKRTLLLIAGIVWLIAGFNVARLGFQAYSNLSAVKAWEIVLSVVIFILFGWMFFKMSIKHNKRIKNYAESYRPVWHFFDLKSYIIMAVMMSGGIALRYSHIVSETFIAFFYTGLGLALALAGLLFFILYFTYKE